MLVRDKRSGAKRSALDRPIWWRVRSDEVRGWAGRGYLCLRMCACSNVFGCDSTRLLFSVHVARFCFLFLSMVVVVVLLPLLASDFAAGAAV